MTKNPNYGIYPFEELQQAGAFLGECGQVGDQCYGIPDNHYTSREQWEEEQRARRLLDAQYKREAKREVSDDLREWAILETYRTQPALRRYYSKKEYLEIRLRMLRENQQKTAK